MMPKKDYAELEAKLESMTRLYHCKDRAAHKYGAEIKEIMAERDELRDFIIHIAKDVCIWAERKDEPALYEIIDRVEEQLGEPWHELIARIDKDGEK